MSNHHTPVDPPEQDLIGSFKTTLHVGEILRRARTHAGYSVDDIEQHIRIRSNHIAAMEDERWDSLPGRVYIFGFLRTYAEFLGLDSEKMVQLLKRQSGSKVQPKPLVITVEEEDKPLPSPKIIAAIAGCFFLVLMILNLLSSMTTAKQEIPKVPSEVTARLTAPPHPVTNTTAALALATGEGRPSAANGNTAAPPGQPTTAPTPPPGTTQESGAALSTDAPKHPIILKAVQNVWLEIRDSKGVPIFSRVLNVGEEYWIPENQTDLVMTLGNAGGLEILVEGEKLPLLGREGQVIRNISLQKQPLKERASKQMLKNPSKRAM